MSQYFRAVAIDYDGTLADWAPPGDQVLTAVAEARRGGRKLVLVTGRILDALGAVFPAAETTFDAIVAENGAVIWTRQLGARTVAPPVPDELAIGLAGRGVVVERGRVLLAMDAIHDRTVLEEVRRLGLEVQLVRNRQALMVLPSGVSKGTGLLEALGALGVSRHSTLAVGDAENDHSLLETCELGVAVANAIPALQAHADVVLKEMDGAGVLELLHGPQLRGDLRVQPKRWQVRLGTQPNGAAATIPGSQVNLVIAGGPTSGKSCLAGLLAERLVTMGYSVCVLDPEGDHPGLGELRGIMVTGGVDPWPSAEYLGRLLRHGYGSVVVDLSLRAEEQRAAYCRRALRALGQVRTETGLPHWIILDEAHLVPDALDILAEAEGPPVSGLCLVTYHPDRLRPEALREMDFAVVCPGQDAVGLEQWLRAGGFPRTGLGEAPRAWSGGLPGSALLVDRESARFFTVDRRVSTHVRHWHKYLSAELPLHRRFFFRRGPHLTGASAANLAEFHQLLERCDPEVLRHHAKHRDFSRWTDAVIQDRELARRILDVEAQLAHDGADTEAARHGLLQAVEARYSEG